jgi:ABC-type phosphate transport system substrate-binding protein
METRMTRNIRLVACAVVAGAGFLAAAPASAQTMCNDATVLPNPIIVSGSTAFEPTLRQIAAKLAAETSPYSIILATGPSGSCNGVASIANSTDLGGTSGRYYTGATGATMASCTFATGQKPDVGISDVYYEACMNVTQPRPADIMDVAGPAQAMLFVVPKANTTTQGLTYKEAQTLYGCGVSPTKPIAGFSMPAGVYCRDASSGTQITIARNIGVPETVLTTPICVNGGGTGGVVNGVTQFADAQNAIGFIGADAFDANRTTLNSLAFQALGQTKAYYADSSPDISDRKNVRDGHYTIWGYEHFIARATNGSLSTRAADFIGYVNGTKTSTSWDFVAIEGGAGVIPLCAMNVKRSSDGGLLSPSTPPETCNCAFEAAITKTTPASCTACTGTGTGTCTGGKSCHHGFCE